MKIGETMPFMYGNEKMVGTVHKLGNVDGIPSVMFKVKNGYITKPLAKVIEQNKKFDEGGVVQ